MNTLPLEVQEGITQSLKKYPPDRKLSAIKDALSLAQASNQGWLTTDLMDAVAHYLDVPRVAVYEVATFYTLFETQPVGAVKISLCTNVSCHLNGAQELLAFLQKELGVSVGETTPDGRFTLKEVECLAACAAAPVLQCQGRYYEHLTKDKVQQLLQEWRAQ